MQGAGQYGVPDVPQYVVGRVPPPAGHMFNLSHELSLPPSGHSHPHSHTASHPQHQHQQNLSHHLQPQFHTQHPQHQGLPFSQPQQITQQQHGYAQQSPKQQPQQEVLAPAQAQTVQQRIQQQQHVQPSQQQQQMVQQLTLASGSPPEAPSPIPSRPVPIETVHSKALVPVRDESLDAEEQDALGEEGEKGTAGNRWPRQETLALLKIRSDMDAMFRDSSLKAALWEEVSRKLAEMGYHRSAKKCKEKFENVFKYYKRTKDGKAGRQDGKSYRFFSQLEGLCAKTTSFNNKTTTTSPINASNGAGTFGLLKGPTTRDPRLPTHVETGRTLGTGERTGSAVKPESDISSGLNFSSDFSDDDSENLGDSGNPDSRKRKRKSTKKYLLFFESVIKKVLDKQEQMQLKFLEALERRDHDRIIREEAWKRLEMARLNKEQDLRAQEHAVSASRDAAVVAFLQKMTGQSVQLPNAVPLQAQPTAMVPFDMDKEFSDPNNKRWPKPEVLALIKLRMAMDQKFHEPGSKALLWEEIAAAMSCQGYSRSAKRCKEKWENINKYFKKAKESNKKRPENAKTCPYYHHLDAMYKEGVLGSKQQLLLDKAEEQSEGLLEEPNESNTREDSGQAQEGDSEILAIMPAAENDPAGMTTSNNVAAHFYVNNLGTRTKENQMIDSSSVTPPAASTTLASQLGQNQLC